MAAQRAGLTQALALVKTVLRLLILVSIAFCVGVPFVPFGDSYAVTVDLDRVSLLASTAQAITPFLGIAAVLSLIASSIGLFFLRWWARPLSKAATLLFVCFIALMQLFNPLMGAVPTRAIELLSIAGLTWIAVLWISHSKSLDAQFQRSR